MDFFAFLDDISILTKPERVGAVYAVLQEELLRHAHIRINGGKTHVWNAVGIEPPVCEALQRIAEVSDPSARVWRGSDIPPHRQGIRVLGATVGHPDYVRRAQLEMKQAEHQVLLDRIPALPDLQSTWALLVHCAASRANYFLRVVPFASAHDRSLWTCLCNMMGIAEDTCEASPRSRFVATCPWWARSQKCPENPPFCLLGKLGGLAEHGAKAPSQRR